MRRLSLSARLALALAALSPLGVRAQAQATPVSMPAPGIPRPANDSLFRYARKLVLEGNGVAGRALVDSLLAAAAPGTPAYGDALYWHGALAATLAEAERDYRRVIVEYPLAYYADDALLAIAELEQGRGDRAGALAHLQRFVHEHPASPARGIAALGAARLAFEQNDTKVGCAMITEARASAGKTDVELANQIQYFSARCPAPAVTTVAKLGSVPTKAATPVDTQSAATKSGVPRVEPNPLPATPVDTPARATAKPAAPTTVAPKPVPPKAVAPAHGRYTIQLAAYNTRPEAERMVATLVKRGLQARVSGTAKPFRVRLQYFATRSAAASEAAALKARGIIGFVAEEP